METPYNIKNILVPIDFSETSLLAVAHATQIANLFKAKIHLLHVITSGSYRGVLPSIEDQNPNDNLVEEISDAMNKLMEEFEGAYEVIISDGGNASREIVQLSNDTPADMVVMGTHGVSGFEEFFIGSNAYRVVTAAKCPVLSVQGHAKNSGYRNIALVLDSSVHTRDKVPHAMSMAKAFGAKVHIAALITEDHEEEKNQFNLKVKQVEEYLEHNGVDYVSSFKHGNNIASMSMEFSKEVGADLMVIMTEQEASTGLFMGSYAQQIVNHSKVPILSVTPNATIQGYAGDALEGDARPFSFY